MKSIRSTNPRLLACLLTLGAVPVACGHAPERTAAARAAAVTCPPESPVVDLGDLPLAFVENLGQSPGEVLYQGIGLGAGTLAVTSSSLRLDLADSPGAKGTPAASVILKHEGASLALAPAAGSALASTSTFITASGTTSLAPNHGALSQEDLYPGIGVRFDGTLRKLVTTYTVAPGASARDIRFRYEGASDVSLDAGVGSVSVIVADGARTLSLGPAEAEQVIDGEVVPVEAHYVIDDGSIGVTLGDHDASAPVEIRTRLLHSRFFRAGGTTRSNGYAYAVGRAYRATSSEADSGGDAYLAILDDTNGALASTTFLVGEGEDEAHAVAVAENGDVLLAGQTRSLAFPTESAAQAANAGGSDGFVVRLNAEGTALLRGTYLGTSGEDAATGIIESPSGDVLVASTSTKSREAVNASAASFVVTLPAQGQTRVDVPYALTALGAALDTVSWVAPLRGNRIRRPRVWIDCNGLVRFGVRGLRNLDCTTYPDKSYEMREIGGDYVQDQPFLLPSGQTIFGWGYHALRWKSYLVNDTLLPGYTGSQTALSFAPLGTTSYYNIPRDSAPRVGFPGDDADLLNFVEDDPAGDLIFDPANPRGEWERGDHDTPETLAVKAALLEKRWGTPVYLGKVSFELSGNASLHAMVVEQTTFDMCFDPALSNYAGQGLEDLCTFPAPGDWYGNVDCSGSSIHDASFTITSFGVSAWSEPYPMQPYFHEHFTLDPYPAGYPTWWWYEPGRFVFDPPNGELQANAKLDEAADRIAGHVTANAAMEEREIKGGAVKKTWTASIVARASDLR